MPPQLHRLLIIFAVIAAVFVTLRWVARPQSFGEYGHYRGDALSEAIQREPAYVPREQCKECHNEEAAKNAAGPHQKTSCQTCHGSGREHCAEPDTKNIQRPEARAFCIRCHQELQARPANFPQIDVADHAGDETCASCHDVHDPSQIKE